ncbi:MAG: pesticidal protein Cry7Aa [Lutibacter sp.]|nr:pesticidal protein Cry7Aa [Lutibacter sp.]
MLTVKKHGVILEKTDYKFENEGVFNPGIFQDGNTVHMFYRAVREGNFSSVGYCKLSGPLTVVERRKKPIFYSEESYEFQGVEDPRITKIENTFHMAYAAYDGINVFGAYATSKDLKNFERKGVITPKFTFEEYEDLVKGNCDKISDVHIRFYSLFMKYRLAELMKDKIYVWDKDIVFFPKKINGKFAVLHRLYPSIQMLYFNDPEDLTIEFWKKYISNLHKHVILSPEGIYESAHIGAGCPPIETEKGWLLIYHSAQTTPKGVIYHATAALLDLENPTIVKARLKKPLFSPTEPWEIKGFVNNVVFPTGTALFNEDLYIYYGAADSRVAVASVNINDLLHELINK